MEEEEEEVQLPPGKESAVAMLLLPPFPPTPFSLRPWLAKALKTFNVKRGRKPWSVSFQTRRLL